MMNQATNSAVSRLPGLGVRVMGMGAAAAILLASFALPGIAAPGDSRIASAGLDRGITKPSDQSELAFVNPGVIREVKVKAGDPVKVGQVIARQDDSEEAVLMEIRKAEYQTALLQVDAAKAELADKRVKLKRQMELYGEQIARNPNFTNSDLEEARVGVQIGEIAVKYREADVTKARIDIEAGKVKLNQRLLISPIDGVVARVDAHGGEGTDMAKPAGILLVHNEPLWVEVNLPSNKTLFLKKGQKLPVRYVDFGDWMEGEVIHLADVANPGANVRLVRLVMPNSTRREAGLQVFVKLPDESASDAAPSTGNSESPAARPAASDGSRL